MPKLPATPGSPSEFKTNGLHGLLAKASLAVSDLCSVSDECLMRLNQIEEQLDETEGIEGVRVLRFRLEECLQKLREETRRQREEMSQALGRLQRDVHSTEAGDGDTAVLESEVDKVSGLETRQSAEQSLASAMRRGGASYAVLFVVDRLHLINAQFEYATGDRILRKCAEHIRSGLLAEDHLFRWTGPAFLVVMERSESPAEVESEIHRLAGARLEAAVQIGNGCVRLPIVRNSLLLPLGGTGGLAGLTGRLDTFGGMQARR